MSDPIQYYSRQQAYQLDKLAMSDDAQSSQQLMGRAARACWNAIAQRAPNVQKIVVLAGVGNNGGDAFGVAALALRAGCTVELLLVGELTRQSEASAFYRSSFEQLGGKTQRYSGQIPPCDVIVDGLFGIGLERALNEKYQMLIEQLNAQPACRVAIDIPSGLNADTGVAMPLAFKADFTVSFIARKIGCFIADGPDYCGQLLFDDLGLSRAVAQKVPPLAQSLSPRQIRLPLRPNNSHKNRFGHVLVIGGAPGMSGAVRLAAQAALRSGAGLVSACVHADNVAIVAGAQAEIMVSDWSQLSAMLKRASVIVVGPGLGQSKAAQELLNQLAECELPMVIDADALTIDFVQKTQSRERMLTPHPGEAARLLQSDSAEVQRDRIEALQQLIDRFSATVVLKGAGSLVGSKNERIHLCAHGHSGMATAGMGDVLAGLAAGYFAQGLSGFHALQTAVLVHALAAELFAEAQDQASLIASDVSALTGRVVRAMRREQAR